MYAIVVYDVHVDKVQKVNTFLKRYLFWVQNSVFEGEVSESQLREVQKYLENMLDPDESTVIFLLRSAKYVRRIQIGRSTEPNRII